MSLIGFRQRLIALLCVLGMSCSAFGILPALAVLVGQLDSDHEVLVSSSGEELEVRFHHLGASHSHHKGVHEASWAPGTPDSHGDHVMMFPSSGPSLVPLHAPLAQGHHSQCLAAIQTEQWKPVVRGDPAVPHARPPPGEGTLTRCLRSVVLLV